MANDPIRKHIANIMRGTGMTPKELAKRAGVSRSTVNRLLDKKQAGRTMYTRTLGKIVVALKMGMQLPIQRQKRLTQTVTRVPLGWNFDELPSRSKH